MTKKGKPTPKKAPAKKAPLKLIKPNRFDKTEEKSVANKLLSPGTPKKKATKQDVAVRKHFDAHQKQNMPLVNTTPDCSHCNKPISPREKFEVTAWSKIDPDLPNYVGQRPIAALHVNCARALDGKIILNHDTTLIKRLLSLDVKPEELLSAGEYTGGGIMNSLNPDELESLIEPLGISYPDMNNDRLVRIARWQVERALKIKTGITDTKLADFEAKMDKSIESIIWSHNANKEANKEKKEREALNPKVKEPKMIKGKDGKLTEAPPKVPKANNNGKRIWKLGQWQTANPRKEGTHGWNSFNVLVHGMTVEEYTKAGGRKNDLAWDVDHSYVVLADEPPVQAPPAQPKPSPKPVATPKKAVAAAAGKGKAAEKPVPKGGRPKPSPISPKKGAKTKR